MPTKIALVTGASRGVGAAVAKLLAARGADVVLNYRSKGARAEQVAAEVEVLGRRALLAQADVTLEADLRKMMAMIEATFAKLDLLILSASGGLEKNKATDYALNLNLTAQVQTLELAVPLMPRGGRVVFVTSHLAHFHGEKPVFLEYEGVAASKKAGETALREHIPELATLGISLVIVSGDLIEGTITPKLLERAAPRPHRDAPGAGGRTADGTRLCRGDCGRCGRCGRPKAGERRDGLRGRNRLTILFS